MHRTVTPTLADDSLDTSIGRVNQQLAEHLAAAAPQVDLAGQSVQTLLTEHDRTSPHASAEHIADVLSGVYSGGFTVHTSTPALEAEHLEDFQVGLWDAIDRACPAGWRVVGDFTQSSWSDGLAVGGVTFRPGLSELQRVAGMRAVEQLAGSSTAGQSTVYLCLPA